MKTYHVMKNIGKTRYLINYHNGIKHYSDGSKFYDIAILHNKKELALFVNNLKNSGYKEKGD